MTLDISKYLKNLIQKEAKISHFQAGISAGKAEKLSMKIKTSIMSKYGESYLQDANYIVFFVRSAGWTAADKKKLFDLTNRALGKDANGMTESDFKELPFEAPTEAPDISQDEEGAEETSTAESDITTTLFMKITIK